MNKPFFSIVTICYQDIIGLQETCKSLELQGFSSFEWIVVDGGSDDGTVDFLKSVTMPLSWVSERDRGIYDAMNKGLKQAVGKYVVFMNAGDQFCDASVLSSVYNNCVRNNLPDFVYGDSYETLPNGAMKLKAARDVRYIWYGMISHHQAMFYRLEAVGGLSYELDYKVAGDYAFTSRFLLAKGRRSLKLDLPICIFASGGISTTLTKIAAKEQAKIWTSIHDMPLVMQWAVRLFQKCAFHLKNKLPKLYSSVRYKR